jgi:hypothetical protein
MNSQEADQKRVEILEGAIKRCLKTLSRTLVNIGDHPSRYEAQQMDSTLKSALRRCARKEPR